MLSVVFDNSLLTVERAGLPVAAGERSACQPGVSLRLILLAEWGSWWVFGSQLRLSKVETFLHFRFAEF